MSKKVFQYCSLCGKRLIERRTNGLWQFVFGRNQNDPGKPPVEIFIHGSLKMRCLRRSCRTTSPDHWNIFNFFPHIVSNTAQVNQAKPEEEEPISSGLAENSGISGNNN
jgi:hypothetical protein